MIYGSTFSVVIWAIIAFGSGVLMAWWIVVEVFFDVPTQQCGNDRRAWW